METMRQYINYLSASILRGTGIVLIQNTVTYSKSTNDDSSDIKFRLFSSLTWINLFLERVNDSKQIKKSTDKCSKKYYCHLCQFQNKFPYTIDIRKCRMKFIITYCYHFRTENKNKIFSWVQYCGNKEINVESISLPRPWWQFVPDTSDMLVS